MEDVGAEGRKISAEYGERSPKDERPPLRPPGFYRVQLAVGIRYLILSVSSPVPDVLLAFASPASPASYMNISMDQRSSLGSERVSYHAVLQTRPRSPENTP